MTDDRLASKPEYWRGFADIAASGGDSPVYAAIARAVADDPPIRALADGRRPGQPAANVLLGAVHFLLLGGADHTLRLWYSHLLRPGEAGPPIGPDLYAAFRDFVATREDQIRAIVGARVTNTNEVLRCAYLRCGYAEIARRTGSPIHLVEIGPSAGLNLNWDRYACAYSKSGAATLRGGPDSALTLEAEWRGEVPPPVPADPPAVAYRVGLELNPVDLTSEADRRWLVALLWPGRPERIARLAAALEIAAAHPPPIRAGDALALLPEELAKADPAAARVVVHTLVTYQWTEEMRARLDSILREASRERPVYRLFQDTIAKGQPFDRTPLQLFAYEGGERREEELADAHHHGAWIAWQG